MILTKKQLRKVIREAAGDVVDKVLSEGFNMSEFVKWQSFKESWEAEAFMAGWDKTVELLRKSPPTNDEMESLGVQNSGHYASVLRDRMKDAVTTVIKPYTMGAKYPNSAHHGWLNFAWHNMVSNLVATELKTPGSVSNLPSGKTVASAIKQKELDRQAKRVSDLKVSTDRVVQDLKDVDPKSIVSGPTFGHTSMNTTYAPENLSDKDAVYWLLDKFTGAPMWKFLIHRDPKDGRIYAYTEIDSS